MIASQLQTKAETARTSGNKANVLEMHSAVNFHFLRGIARFRLVDIFKGC